MDYIPRSNDPTCSAGFGMGLVMYLGPQIILTGGRSALAQCLRLPTRYRSYTCVHGIGHALMRGYHGRLRQSVAACRKLGEQAPDCAQGAFHDYWISLRGADGTVRRAHGASPRFLCNGHLWYVRPCWYRYFVEDATAPLFDDPASIRKACAGLRGLQRYGCVSAAALSIPEDPFEQTRICARLGTRRGARACAAWPCRRSSGARAKQLALFTLCTRMPRGETGDCRRWFGRTLALVTDGRFRCPGPRVQRRRGADSQAARDFLLSAPVSSAEVLRDERRRCTDDRVCPQHGLRAPLARPFPEPTLLGGDHVAPRVPGLGRVVRRRVPPV